IMRMALLERRCRNLVKSAVLLQFFYGACSAVAHTGAESAHKLEHSILYRSLVSDTSFHAFRNKFLRVLLEIAVFASLLHRSDRAHSAVYLVLSSLIQLECSRALVASCEDASHHTYIRACRDRLRHIAGVLDSSVRNDRDAILFRHLV